MLLELREVLNDDNTDGVFAESTLLGYLSEGQDKFCELTGYFTDISTYSITMVDGTAIYDIPDRVIQVLDIYDGTRKLTKVKMGEDYSASDAEGTPAKWDANVETGSIKFYPTPSADDGGNSLILQVWRYSQEDLADTTAEPEIPARFHRACIEWAAFKAFMHHDMEAQDPVKSSDHYNAFMAYVRDGRVALRRYQNQETRVGSDPAYRT
jgi:hypothetical protein